MAYKNPLPDDLVEDICEPSCKSAPVREVVSELSKECDPLNLMAIIIQLEADIKRLRESFLASSKKSSLRVR